MNVFNIGLIIIVVLALVARIIQIQVYNKRYECNRLKRVEERKRLEFDLRNLVLQVIDNNLNIDEDRKIDLITRSELSETDIYKVLKTMIHEKMKDYYYFGDETLADAGDIAKKCTKEAVTSLSYFLAVLESDLNYEIRHIKLKNYGFHKIPQEVANMITFKKLQGLTEERDILKNKLQELQRFHELEMRRMESEVSNSEMKAIFGMFKKLG